MKLIGGILIALGIVYAIAFVPVMFLGSAYPTAGIISPLVCGGSGYEIQTEQGQGTRLRTAMSISVECVNPETDARANPNLLLPLAVAPGIILGIIGIAIFNIGAVFGGFGGFSEMQEIAKVPEVKARLDALMEDFKAGRISQSDYMTMMQNIINEYKARQAAIS